MKIIKNIRFRFLFGGFLVIAALFYGYKTFSLDTNLSGFNLSNYPGMCRNSVSCNANNCNIELRCCLVGESQGNYSLPTTYSVHLTRPASCADATAPWIIINTPPSDSTVTGAVTVLATASDNVGVASVKFYIDGTFVQADTASPYDYNWQTTAVSNGSHTIKAEAYDAAGNTSSATAAVTVHNSLATICSTYTYNSWGACVSGQQIRTIASQLPAGCTDTSSAVLTQTCAAAVVPCTSYTYGAWGNCVSGQQARSIATAYPSGCDYQLTGSAVPVLTQTCAVAAVPCTSYTYGAWGNCVSGQQARSIATAYPSGCDYQLTGSAVPVLTQTCAAAAVPCTSYTYGAWSACENGHQTRSVVDKYPPACTDYSSADLSRTCIVCQYTYGEWSECDASGQQNRNYDANPDDCVQDPNNPPQTVKTCVYEANIPCTGYNYSGWSGCKSSGKQERTILSNIPTNCTPSSSLSANPELSRSCTVCAYDCGSWGACANGTQARTCQKNPADCVVPDDTTAIPSLSRSCTATDQPASCIYIYSAWGDCSAAGKQIRTVTKSPENCVEDATNMPVLEKTCTPPVSNITCTYQCAAWGACSSDGVRSRTCSKTPENCIAPAVVPATKETCPPCAYTYGEWKACASDGKQVRDFKQSPEICYQKEKPAVEQTCTYDQSVCTYAYGAWGSCSTAGIQTRTYVKVPEKCVEKNMEPPVWQQNCVPGTPASCNYIYGDWGGCVDGKRSRTVVSKTPAGCKEDNPLIEEQCEEITGSKEKPEEEKPAPVCVYEYSAWSDCANGSESRMVIEKKPAGCAEIEKPVLNRACKNTETAAERPADVPAPDPASVLKVEESENLNGKTTENWQKYYFGSEICRDEAVCAGLADPDNDGLINNEEQRFGTDPKDADTDGDGHVDGEEVINKTDPLVKPNEEKSDEIVFENPKEKGEIKGDVLKVVNVETIQGESEQKKATRLSGTALPDTYVTIYIYSYPIVLTAKTDSYGNWSYIIEDPVEDGTHEVYVAVTDNTGKITAKSDPLTFVQTAEAASVIPAKIDSLEKKTAAPSKSRLAESYFIFGAAGLGGLLLALAAIGMLKGKKEENN